MFEQPLLEHRTNDMKLLFIYGPPAAGKLSVANEVAKIAGFKVFHNHLSIDAIVPIFKFGSRPFMKLVEMIRVETVGEAARENVDLIFTFCYAKGIDEEHVEKVETAARENGAEVYFVLLRSSEDELKRRIVLEDRRKHGKANTIEMIENFLESYDLCSPIPGTDSLEIDNTDLSPQDAARRIVEHFCLQQQQPVLKSGENLG